MKLIKRWRNNREIYLFTETLKEANSFLKVVRIYFFFILFSIFFLSTIKITWITYITLYIVGQAETLYWNQSLW